MSNKLTSLDLFQRYGKTLGLHWVAGDEGQQHALQQDINTPANVLAGYLNLVRPNRIQVLGPAEVEYLNKLGKNSREDAIKRLFNSNPAMIIFADDAAISTEIINLANTFQTPLYSSSLTSDTLIELLQYHLSKLLSTTKVLHGVFMEVMGLGCLLTGPSGIGKSELALELLSRGHRLIADDAPVFRRSAPEIIRGSCPDVLKDFIEVRGLGVLNVRAMFGDNAVMDSKRLRLIIHLEEYSDPEIKNLDRLSRSQRSRSILEVEIPEVLIPVAPGRNVAVIIEAAVRNHVLYLNGYNAAEDFIRRQQAFLEQQAEDNSNDQ